MADPSSRYKISRGEPEGGWPPPHGTIDLKLYYSKDGHRYIFKYRVDSADVPERNLDDIIGKEVEFLTGRMVRDSESEIYTIDADYRQELDIGIAGNVTVTVKIIENDPYTGLYWYQKSVGTPKIEAVMTENDRKHYYGELRYSNNGVDWFETIPGDECRYIRFKARKRLGWPRQTHKFSYNVRIPDPDGNPAHLEIDPDIQNPKA